MLKIADFEAALNVWIMSEKCNVEIWTSENWRY
jgi:hypothetical protein